MVAVAICIETPTIFRRRTIAASAVIPFGTVMRLTDNNTVEASASDDDVFGGIAWKASLATDTFTDFTVAMDGLWGIITDSGTDAVGTLMQITTANTVGNADAAAVLLGSTVGRLEEVAPNAAAANIRVGDR